MANKRTPSRRNIWRLASESTVRVLLRAIGDFSRISFLRGRAVESQISRPGHDVERLTAGRRADAHLRFLVIPKGVNSAHVTASLSLISRRLLALAFCHQRERTANYFVIVNRSNHLAPDNRESEWLSFVDLTKSCDKETRR